MRMASTVLEDLADRAMKFDDNTGNCIREIIMDNDGYILGFNTDVQLYGLGENRLGVSIMDYMPYSVWTMDVKTKKGQPCNRVTLHDEGDFHRSFYIEADNEQFEIKASDWKTDALTEKYGKEILGLNDGHRMEVAWDYLYPELLEKLRSALQMPPN